MWFDYDRWGNREITFDSPQGPSSWKIIEQTHEREMLSSEWGLNELGALSQARAIFTCVNDQGQTALLKVRMQIPLHKTASTSREERAKQARPDIHFGTRREVDALQTLTQAGCSSSPNLIAWKHELQGDADWVPGGFVDYILMKKVSGTTPPYYWEQTITEQERNELLAAFKSAYIECWSCGRVSLDCAPRNIVWNHEAGKCYIVDWEQAFESSPKNKWREVHYFFWGLKSMKSCKAAERMEHLDVSERNKENAR